MFGAKPPTKPIATLLTVWNSVRYKFYYNFYVFMAEIYSKYYGSSSQRHFFPSQRRLKRALMISHKRNGSSWWRHQMETFSALLALCAGNSPLTSGFHSQRPATRSFDFFSLICAWINSWVNNREVGDLRRHRAHYDVIVMFVKVRFFC